MEQYLPYLKWIDHQLDHMKELVVEWGNINSHAFNYTGLEEQMLALKKSFGILQGSMQEISLPPYTVIDEHGNKTQVPLGKALHITKRLDAPLRILLSGHMDTVYAKTSPFQRVSETEAGTLLGPGVCDMKGGLVVLLTALQAVEKSPYAEQIGWEIIINPDEEIGSPGSHALLENAAKKQCLGLVFEPAYADGAVVTIRPGSSNLVVVIRGKAAHAGRDFLKGRSALFIGASIVKELEAMNTLRTETDEQDLGDHVLVNVGEFQSGNSFNVVPDLAIIRVNIRAPTSELLQNAKKQIEKIVDTYKNRDGIIIHLHEQISRPAKQMDSRTQKLLNMYQTCATSLEHPFSTKPSRGVSDANILAAAGLATLDTLGGIGGDIHTHNEYLVVESLRARAKLAALLLMRLGSGEFSFDQKTHIIEL